MPGIYRNLLNRHQRAHQNFKMRRQKLGSSVLGLSRENLYIYAAHASSGTAARDCSTAAARSLLDSYLFAACFKVQLLSLYVYVHEVQSCAQSKSDKVSKYSQRNVCFVRV